MAVPPAVRFPSAHISSSRSARGGSPQRSWHNGWTPRGGHVSSWKQRAANLAAPIGNDLTSKPRREEIGPSLIRAAQGPVPNRVAGTDDRSSIGNSERRSGIVRRAQRRSASRCRVLLKQSDRSARTIRSETPHDRRDGGHRAYLVVTACRRPREVELDHLLVNGTPSGSPYADLA